MTAVESRGQTFARLLLEQARVRPDHPALRHKSLGIWQTWTWRQVADEARAFAAGLLAAGVVRGQAVAIVGRNRPRLYFAMLGAQAIGAIPVPMHDDESANEIVPMLERTGVAFAFAENQEQVDKLLEVRKALPALTRIVYLNSRGLHRYEQPGLMSCEAMLEAGAPRLASVDAEIAAGKADDVAVVLHTSGTTGEAKIGRLTHGALARAAASIASIEGLTEHEEVLAHLPLAWVKQHLVCHAQWLICGFTVNCPESADTVATDLRDIGPTYHITSPRDLESLLKQVTLRMEDASGLKRALYLYFMAVAARVGDHLLEGDPVPLADRLAYQLGNWLVYSPLKDALGMTRIRVAHVAGEAVGTELFALYRSLGINLKQVYGATEAAGVICVQRSHSISADSVGQPIEGVELRLSESSELMVRGPTLALDVADAEGWFHTGDAAQIAADGSVRIIDRKADLIALSGQASFSPKLIESRLRFTTFIKEAVVFGDGRASVVALINIDYDSVRDWAERRELSYSGYAELAALPETVALLGDAIAQVNAALATDPALTGAQVRRFAILHKELDPDDLELTRTHKLRRGQIARKYALLVEAMHAGRREQHVDIEVQFEDGRIGALPATLLIHDARLASTSDRAGFTTARGRRAGSVRSIE